MNWKKAVMSACLLVAITVTGVLAPVRAQDEGWITHRVALSPDASVVVHGSMHAERADSWIIVGDAKKNVEIARVRYSYGPMRDVSFSRDGILMATTTGHGRIRLYQGRGLRVLHEHPGHESWVLAVALSPDGTILASSGRDKWILVRDSLSGRQLRDPIPVTEQVSALLFVPKTGDLVVGHGRSLSLLEKNGKTMRVIEESLPQTAAFDISADGRWLAAVHRNGDLRVWDFPAEKLLFKARADQSRAYSLAFSPDGRHVVTSGVSPFLKIWKRESGSLLASVATERAMIAAAWVEEHRIVGADYAGQVTIWERKRNIQGDFEWRRQATAQQADAADRPSAGR